MKAPCKLRYSKFKKIYKTYNPLTLSPETSLILFIPIIPPIIFQINLYPGCLVFPRKLPITSDTQNYKLPLNHPPPNTIQQSYYETHSTYNYTHHEPRNSTKHPIIRHNNRLLNFPGAISLFPLLRSTLSSTADSKINTQSKQRNKTRW